ncbi:hypothetical protein V8C26DRAFT_66858 [Trichoderma gracile]
MIWVNRTGDTLLYGFQACSIARPPDVKPKSLQGILGIPPLKRLMNEIRVWPPSTAAAYPHPPSKNGCMHGKLLGYFHPKFTAPDRRLCQRARGESNLALLESFCSSREHGSEWTSVPGALFVDRRPILFRSRPWGARTGGPHPDVLPATPSRPSGHLYRHTQARAHTSTHLCVIIGSISSHSRVSAGPLTSINHSPPSSAVLKLHLTPMGLPLCFSSFAFCPVHRGSSITLTLLLPSGLLSTKKPCSSSLPLVANNSTGFVTCLSIHCGTSP